MADKVDNEAAETQSIDFNINYRRATPTEKDQGHF